MFLLGNATPRNTSEESYCSVTYKNREALSRRPDGSFLPDPLKLKKVKSAHRILGRGACSLWLLRMLGCPENRRVEVSPKRQEKLKLSSWLVLKGMMSAS